MTSGNLFQQFVTKPAVYYCPGAKRYEGTVFCDNCDCITDKHFGINNPEDPKDGIDVCIHCFISLHTHAAIAREKEARKPRHAPIDGVDWTNANEQGLFRVTFRNNTFEYLPKDEIIAEIKRQDLRENAFPKSFTNNYIEYLGPRDAGYGDEEIDF